MMLFNSHKFEATNCINVWNLLVLKNISNFIIRNKKKQALGDKLGKEDMVVLEDESSKDKKKNRVAVDATFFRRLLTILKICIPTWKSKEFFNLVILSVLLVCKYFKMINLMILTSFS
jgi:hypothetical protein